MLHSPHRCLCGECIDVAIDNNIQTRIRKQDLEPSPAKRWNACESDLHSSIVALHIYHGEEWRSVRWLIGGVRLMSSSKPPEAFLSLSLSLFPSHPPLITDVAFYLAHTNCHWPPAHGPIEEAAKYNNYLCVRVCLWWWTNFLNRSCGFPVNRWARAQVNRPVERKLMCSRFETQSTPSAHSTHEGEENHSGKWNNAVPVRR